MIVLRHAIGQRRHGILFLRRCAPSSPSTVLLGQAHDELATEMVRRAGDLSCTLGQQPTRAENLRLAKTLWRDAGGIKTDTIRSELMRLTRRIGLAHVTAPKCWRHTFATLLQEAGVDPLIRQQTMGHVPAGLGAAALGMTAHYTHTQAEVHRRQLAAALALRPRTVGLVATRFGNGSTTQEKGGES